MELKVGDRVYKCYRGTPTHILTIVRTTKTQAISKTSKFKKKFTEGSWIAVIGADSYSTGMYYLETPELKEKLKRLRMIKKLEAMDLKGLEYSKLKDLFNYCFNNDLT